MRKRSPLATLIVGLASAVGCGDNHPQPATDASDPGDAATVDAAAVDAARADAAERDAPSAVDAAVAPDAASIPNLRLRYAFEEGSGPVVVDSSGQGRSGTLTGTTAWAPNGGRGQSGALALTGAEYVSLPDGVLTGVDAFTIATWVNVADNAGWARIYDLGNGGVGTAERFMFMTVSGFTGAGAVGLHASSYGGSGANELMTSAGVALPTGQWKHVALTGAGGTRTLYVDGFPVVTTTGAIVPPRELEPLSGASWLGKSRFPDPGLRAALDEFRIYDRVLGAAEIGDLAWPGRDYAHWRFDEGTGLVAADSSDHHVPTTLTGATWTPGRLGTAVNLAGGSSNAHVAFGVSPLAGCTRAATIATWVRLRATPTWSRIFDFGAGGDHFLFLTPADNAGVLRFAMKRPGAPAFDLVAPAGLPADDAWHHVAVTIADGTVIVYVDGAEVVRGAASDVGPGDFATTPDNWLGRSQFAPDPYLNGAIDELRVSCRAWSADEINLLARR
ncbi:MAG: LamG domain-containing protein [Kofleriaceae bacterium]|jgi:hypothetical protein|nr:LamG domain-containing protein [Kofleriaceae bacterium]MBP9167015.1 LamG domain-containing protein [Kofleriaceae bacterium]MBP9858326.1 LamG domain-containing protein [Kofleriaceae bacterium]